jgi:hypothetical protein
VPFAIKKNDDEIFHAGALFYLERTIHGRGYFELHHATTEANSLMKKVHMEASIQVECPLQLNVSMKQSG